MYGYCQYNLSRIIELMDQPADLRGRGKYTVLDSII